jgi:hypothetical protein
MTKSAQLWLCPLARVRVLFSALQASVQHPHPTHFCKLMTIPSLAIFSLLQLGLRNQALSTLTPTKPPLRAVDPLNRS